MLEIIISLLALAGPAAARNPDLSNWTINLSGDDEPPEETWHDYCQEIEVVGSTVHVTYWTTLWQLATGSTTGAPPTAARPGNPRFSSMIPTPAAVTSRCDAARKYLAVDGNNVHMAYAAYDSTHRVFITTKLIYRRSTDNGASFEDPRPLAPISGGYWWIDLHPHHRQPGEKSPSPSNSRPSTAKRLAVSDGAEFRRWRGRPLPAPRSPTVGTGITVSVGDLKRVGDRIYVLYSRELEAWYDITWNTALYCATSVDGGTTFTHNRMTTMSPVVNKYLTYTTQEASYSPNVALDGNNVYVVWTQNDGYYDSNERSLYIRRSTDQGLNFGEPQKIAQNQTGGIGNMQCGQETVAAKGGYVYVVFMTSDGTVYLRRSGDNGTGFFPLQTMGTGAWWPNLVVDPANGAKVHVFWWSTYRYSADGGASFTNPVVLMPWAGQWQPNRRPDGPGAKRHQAFCQFLYLLHPGLRLGRSGYLLPEIRPGAGPRRRQSGPAHLHRRQ